MGIRHVRIIALFTEGRGIIAADIKTVRFGRTTSPDIGPEIEFTIELIYDTGIREHLGEKGFAVCLLSLRERYSKDPAAAPPQSIWKNRQRACHNLSE